MPDPHYTKEGHIEAVIADHHRIIREQGERVQILGAALTWLLDRYEEETAPHTDESVVTVVEDVLGSTVRESDIKTFRKKYLRDQP